MKWTLFICMLAISTGAFAKAKTPPPPPSSEEDPNLFRPHQPVFSSHVDFLYWRALEGSMSYALKMNSPASSSGGNYYPVGNYKNAEFNMDPGFRIALSYFRAPRYWEVWGMYTRMTSRGKNQTSTPENPSLHVNAVWPTYLSEPLIHAKSSLHLNYNVADMFVDRYFNPNPHLRLRVVGGLTGAWIDQNWTINYIDEAKNTARVRNEWKFGGCGFRAGLLADWFWTYDIYLTSRVTFAALVGPYKNHTFQKTATSAFPTQNITYRDNRAVGHLQFVLGPSWQKNWTGVRTELFAGYELNSWANLQEIHHSTGASASSDPKEPWINTGLLTLQGLTTRLSIDY